MLDTKAEGDPTREKRFQRYSEKPIRASSQESHRQSASIFLKMCQDNYYYNVVQGKIGVTVSLGDKLIKCRLVGISRREVQVNNFVQKNGSYARKGMWMYKRINHRLGRAVDE